MAARLRTLRDRRRSGERGVALVETAMVSMFLMSLVVATFELGMGWRTSITVANAARAGARVGSSLGISNQADYSALLAVAAGIQPSSGRVSINKVIIFESTSASGAVPSACLSLAPGTTYTGSTASSCNVYSGTWITALVAGGSATAFTSTATSTCTSGGGTRPDRWWCPANRNNVQLSTGGLDYFGVYVETTHSTFTKMLGTSFTIKQTSVMRIEPDAGN